jgi:hypothetical protein
MQHLNQVMELISVAIPWFWLAQVIGTYVAY